MHMLSLSDKRADVQIALVENPVILSTADPPQTHAHNTSQSSAVLGRKPAPATVTRRGLESKRQTRSALTVQKSPRRSARKRGRSGGKVLELHASHWTDYDVDFRWGYSSEIPSSL